MLATQTLQERWKLTDRIEMLRPQQELTTWFAQLMTCHTKEEIPRVHTMKRIEEWHRVGLACGMYPEVACKFCGRWDVERPLPDTCKEDSLG